MNRHERRKEYPSVPVKLPEEFIIQPKMAKWKEFLYLSTAVLIVGTGLAAFGGFVTAIVADKHLSLFNQDRPTNECFVGPNNEGPSYPYADPDTKNIQP